MENRENPANIDWPFIDADQDSNLDFVQIAPSDSQSGSISGGLGS